MRAVAPWLVPPLVADGGGGDELSLLRFSCSATVVPFAAMELAIDAPSKSRALTLSAANAARTLATSRGGMSESTCEML